jgi:hypothetical protein
MSQANLPDDIRRIAHAVASDWHQRKLGDDLTGVIGKALLAERMRCADVARAMPPMIDLSPDHVRATRGADYAAAIMRGGA